MRKQRSGATELDVVGMRTHGQHAPSVVAVSVSVGSMRVAAPIHRLRE
jgi:hypothetical protein